jgi:hypothetical protein
MYLVCIFLESVNRALSPVIGNVSHVCATCVGSVRNEGQGEVAYTVSFMWLLWAGQHHVRVLISDA